MFIINSQHGVCEIACLNNSIKSSISRYLMKDKFVLTMLMSLHLNFNNYCMTIVNTVGHLVTDVHMQNDLAESLCLHL